MDKIPHSVCAYYAVKMLRDRLSAIPKKKWDEFLRHVEANIHRHWADRVRGIENKAVSRKQMLLKTAYGVASLALKINETSFSKKSDAAAWHRQLKHFEKEFYLDRGGDK